MPPSEWNEPRFQAALEVLEKACTLARKLQDDQNVEAVEKSDSSPVTVADLAVQILVVTALREKFPEDQFIAEETAAPLLQNEELFRLVRHYLESFGGPWTRESVVQALSNDTKSERRWILDPVDGTKGFLRGDQFAIALAHSVGSEIQFGLLGCPRLGMSGNEHGEGVIGAASLGRGCWQKSLHQSDWNKVEVSSQDRASETRLLRSFEASHTNEAEIETLVENLSVTAEPVRLDSQAKYLLLARGDAEAVIRCLSPKRPNYKEKVWDQAAGSIVVTESGGRITDLAGKSLDFSHGNTLARNTGVIATNKKLHEALLTGLPQ